MEENRHRYQLGFVRGARKTRDEFTVERDRLRAVLEQIGNFCDANPSPATNFIAALARTALYKS